VATSRRLRRAPSNYPGHFVTVVFVSYRNDRAEHLLKRASAVTYEQRVVKKSIAVGSAARTLRQPESLSQAVKSAARPRGQFQVPPLLAPYLHPWLHPQNFSVIEELSSRSYLGYQSMVILVMGALL
jgi:hypothetical protein